MPAATEYRPVILDNAGLEIDTSELACLLNHIEVVPDVATVELKSMCGTVDYPGNVKWSLKATLYQSFDPGATEETLSAAVAGGVAVPFRVVAYRDQAVSATNPEWTGTVIPQPYAPISGDAGDVSSIDLDWSIVGAPTKNIVPEAGALAADRTGELEATPA
jgi:hypothetical protein